MYVWSKRKTLIGCFVWFVFFDFIFMFDEKMLELLCLFLVD